MHHKELGEYSPDKICQPDHDNDLYDTVAGTLNIVLEVAAYPVVSVNDRILDQEVAAGSGESDEELVGERSHKYADV